MVGSVGLDVEKSKNLVQSFLLLNLRQGNKDLMNLNLNDGLQDPAWLDTLVSSPSRFVPLLLKLAYNGCPLKLGAKKAGITSTKKQKGKLCTGSRSKDESDPWSAPCKSVVGLGGQMSSGSKDLDGRIQGLI